MTNAEIKLKDGFNPSDYNFKVKKTDGTILKNPQSGVSFADVGEDSNNYVASRKSDAKEFAEPRKKSVAEYAVVVPNPLAPCVFTFFSFKRTGITDSVTIGGLPYVVGNITVVPPASTSPSVSGTPAPPTPNLAIGTNAEILAMKAEIQETVSQSPIQDVVLTTI
jgi:hypothetical protein